MIDKTLEEIKKKLLTLLKDDDKIELWLNCPNGNFGNSTPMALINANRGHKVLLFINSALEGY